MSALLYAFMDGNQQADSEFRLAVTGGVHATSKPGIGDVCRGGLDRMTGNSRCSCTISDSGRS